ncbi:unnamed protein product [Effrenium voratum]|nr:unnamed protein product [Effrenium voratum]
MQVRRQHALADCTFQPRISASSEQLTSCNAELIGETPEERIQRLAVKDVSRRRLEQQKLQEALYRECTFQPALSPNSETIASARRASSPSRGVHLRLYEEGVEKERAKAIPLAQECSFKPQLDPRASKRFAHVKPHYSSPDDISDSIRQQQERKAEQLLERHAERERAEVAGCTFRDPSCGRCWTLSRWWSAAWAASSSSAAWRRGSKKSNCSANPKSFTGKPKCPQASPSPSPSPCLRETDLQGACRR